MFRFLFRVLFAAVGLWLADRLLGFESALGGKEMAVTFEVVIQTGAILAVAGINALLALAAAWLGGRPYPRARLTDAWTLVVGGQFHDILPGTSIPKAYEYAWNDQVLAMNQFAGVITSATEAAWPAWSARSGVRVVSRPA